MSAAISRHGTQSRYQDGCRCDPCKAANTTRARDARSGTFAGKSELAEWMRGLGWDRNIPTAIPQVFVDRWNREHADRPYIGSQ